MRFRDYLAASAAGLAFAAVAAIEVQAQETTSAIRGMVFDDSGAAVNGATVTITDTRTGLTRTITTDGNGTFALPNLNVGGPYSVEVSAADYQTTQVDDVYVDLGAVADLSLELTSGAAADRIVVTGQQVLVRTAIGPSTSFSLDDLEDSPAINRDIKDVLRQDPRIYLDQTAGGPAGTDGVQCGGSSPRFNSITVDGVGLNDGFGLNSNGYPTERMPFPYDSISQVSVELAPYDVEYGGFTGCAINSVTKSGTNTFHGSAFFDYTDSGLRGDSIQGRNVFVPEFDEKRYGATISGPIIEDRLFFFAAYEKLEGVNLFFRGPVGSGATTEVTGFTQAEYNDIVNIANTVYGISDLGGTPASDPAEDEKYMIRLDANITDRHRAAVTYNYNNALNLTESDTGSTNFEFGGHLYDRGAKLQAYTGQLFSDWTDNFSTELRVSYNDVDATVACRDGGTIGEVRIVVDPGRNAYFGCDDSRHFNDLNYNVLTFKAKGVYQAGDHTLTFGGERQTFDIFNAFTQHTEGEFVFNSIADFRAGQPASIFYGNAAGTNNPDDTAAQFKYDINTIYVQDEFVVGFFDISAGMRWDWYSNDDHPNANAFFFRRNGFTNTLNLDGLGLLQPRLGVNWEATDRLRVRGGVGLFSGGNPNVWVSNSYSNDGVTAVQLEYRNPAALPNFPQAPNILTTPNTGDERGAGQSVNPTGALWGVPTSMYNQVGGAIPNSNTNAIAPGFELPSEWKFSIGATYEADFGGFFGDGYIFDVDYIHSESNAASTIINAALQQIGVAPDGSPLYKRIDRSSAACIANPAAATCAGPADDLLLTNARQGGNAEIFSVSIQKSYEDLGIDWMLGYAYVDARDTRSMTSSVAFSNFTGLAVRDINSPDQARSNFVVPNRFTGMISWEHEFFRDFPTTVSLYGEVNQARYFSFSYAGGGLNDAFGDGQESLHLLYVPNGPTDPNVIFCRGAATPVAEQAACRMGTSGAAATTYAEFDTTSFFNFADLYGLERGAQVSRNDQEGTWNNKVDLRIEQGFPVAFGSSGSVFFTMENVGNFLNDSWGVLREAPFPQRSQLVEIDRDAATNRLVFRRLATPALESTVEAVSFWSVRMGVRLEF